MLQLAKRDLIGMEMLTSSIKSKGFYTLNMANNIEGIINDAADMTNVVINALFNPPKGFEITNKQGNTIKVSNEERSIYSLWISEGLYKKAKEKLMEKHKVEDEIACMFLNQYCN